MTAGVLLQKVKAGISEIRTGREKAGYEMVWRTLVVVTALVVGLLSAKRELAKFVFYDDEGYMLLSLTHFLREGHLYTATYSQYGPFYFYAQEFWFGLLRLPVTHDAGRLVTLIYWLLGGGLSGRFAYKLTGNVLVAAFAILACVVKASILSYEPGHPQQVIVLLFMLASCFAIWRRPGANSLYLFVLGLIGSALLFTKINVGVFFVVALAHSLCCLLPAGPIRQLGVWLTLVYAVAGPLVLMRADLSGWAKGYCLIAIVSGAATFVCGSRVRTDPPMPYKTILWALAGILAGSAMIAGVTLTQGVSFAALLHGVVLDPLKHPRVFFVPMWIGKIRSLLAILGAGCALAVCFLGRRGMALRWLGALQCVSGLAVIFLLFHGVKLASLVPFLPLGLLSCMNGSKTISAAFPRIFITDLAATQFLQAYPVAGSQTSIAALPVVLWAIICVFDGFDALLTIAKGIAPSLQGIPRQAILGAMMMVAFLPGLHFLYDTKFWLRDPYPPSKLAGSAFLHLPPAQEELYRFIADDIKTNCSILFTVPGMGSFNFWSGVPTPNGWNLTGWVNAFDYEKQGEIVAILKSNTEACAIYYPDLLPFWKSNTDQLAKSPLGSYVIFNMVKVVEREGYEIRINPNRRQPWTESGFRAFSSSTEGKYASRP